ncbi:MAG: TetR/AcrR family transcriptional regulator [Thermoleophilaceae bacterium]
MQQSPVRARSYGGRSADERRAERRSKLLEAGLDLLAVEGWNGTTVTAVCQHAQLALRYFYESFRNRDELVVAIFDDIVAEVRHEVRAVLHGTASTVRDTIHANIATWIKVATDDHRKARVAFVEALGSETLMRRRLEATRRFADALSKQARHQKKVSRRQQRTLDAAGRIVAGGLVETMIEWVSGSTDRAADEVIEDFTTLAARLFDVSSR